MYAASRVRRSLPTADAPSLSRCIGAATSPPFHSAPCAQALPPDNHMSHCGNEHCAKWHVMVCTASLCLHAQVFTGEGRNRRAAEHAAAYAALAFIESLGMFAVSRLKLPPAQPPPALVPPALVQAPVTPEEVGTPRPAARM